MKGRVPSEPRNDLSEQSLKVTDCQRLDPPTGNPFDQYCFETQKTLPQTTSDHSRNELNSVGSKGRFRYLSLHYFTRDLGLVPPPGQCPLPSPRVVPTSLCSLGRFLRRDEIPNLPYGGVPSGPRHHLCRVSGVAPRLTPETSTLRYR